jgi:hypothetical protein
MCTKPGLNENTCFVYFVFPPLCKRVSTALTFSHKSFSFAGSPNFGHPTSNFDFLANFGHLLGLPGTVLAYPSLAQLWDRLDHFGCRAQPHAAPRRVFGVLGNVVVFSATLLTHTQLWWHHPNPCPGGSQNMPKVHKLPKKVTLATPEHTFGGLKTICAQNRA